MNVACVCVRTNAVAHPTPEQLLKDALAAQRRGSVGDAKRLYASVLNIDPANGHIKNDDEAMKLWRRDYEPGWEPKV